VNVTHQLDTAACGFWTSWNINWVLSYSEDSKMHFDDTKGMFNDPDPD